MDCGWQTFGLLPAQGQYTGQYRVAATVADYIYSEHSASRDTDRPAAVVLVVVVVVSGVAS